MNYSIIRNNEQYELYLNRFSEIFDIDFSKHPEYEDEFDLLSLLIEDYEKKNFPIDTPSPIDYIKFIMDQKNLTNKDMEKYLGSASKVSEVLSGKRNLSLTMIKKLHNELEIPADILIQDVNMIDDGKMKEQKWLNDYCAGVHEINDVYLSSDDYFRACYFSLTKSTVKQNFSDNYKELSQYDNAIQIH